MEDEVAKAELPLVDELVDETGQEVLKDQLGHVTSRESAIEPEDEPVQVVLACNLGGEKLTVIAGVACDDLLGDNIKLSDLPLSGYGELLRREASRETRRVR